MQTHALFDDTPYDKNFSASVLAVGEQGVALDRTLFYPTGGGQPGDTGHFGLPDGSQVRVLGTQRDPQLRSLIWHQVEVDPGRITQGMSLQGILDWERRLQHMKMHTCLHLLCSIVDAPVTGCSIGHEKGRLDFDLPEMTLDKANITASLIELINAGRDVKWRRIPAVAYAEALTLSRTQATPPPIFDEMVRVIEVVGVDIQPCGGTHVLNTHEIGRVYCDKIEKKSAHNPVSYTHLD